MTDKTINLKGRASTNAMNRQVRALGKAAREAAKGARSHATATEQQASKLDRLEGKLDKASAGMAKVTKILGAAGMVGVAIGAVKQLDALAQRSQQLSDVMGNLPFSVDLAQKATGGLATKFELATAAAKANRFGVARTAESFAELARIGSILGRSIGQGAAKSIEDMTVGIARGSIPILDNLGLKLRNKNEIYADFAASVGKATDELDEQEKIQAVLNETLAAGRIAIKGVRVEVDGAAGDWLRLKTAVTDFAEGMLSGSIAQDRAKAEAVEVAQALVNQGAKFDTAAQSAEEWVGNFRLSEVFMREEWLPTQHDVEDAIRRLTDRTRDLNSEFTDLRAGEAAVFDFSSAMGLESGAATDRRSRGDAKRLADLKFKPTGRRGRSGKSIMDRVAGVKLESGDDLRKAFSETENIVAESFANLQEIENAAEEARLEARLMQIEMARSMGADPVEMILAEKEARLEFAEFLETQAETEAERIQARLEQKRVAHQAEMQLLAQAHAAEAKRAQQQAQLQSQIQNAAMQHAAHIEEAARLAGKGQAAAHVVAMGIRAAVETAEAAAAFARYDYIAFAAHTAAAVLAIAAAAKAASEAGGGVTATNNFATGAAFGGTSGGGQRDRSPSGGEGAGREEIAITRGASLATQQGRGSGGGAGGAQINIENIHVTGEIDEETAQKVGRGIRKGFDANGARF